VDASGEEGQPGVGASSLARMILGHSAYGNEHCGCMAEEHAAFADAGHQGVQPDGGFGAELVSLNLFLRLHRIAAASEQL
jgi:hypothetical protein